MTSETPKARERLALDPTSDDPDQVLERLRRETPFIPTSTVVRGVLAIRPCFINPRTTLREVDGLIDSVVRLGDALTAGA